MLLDNPTYRKGRVSVLVLTEEVEGGGYRGLVQIDGASGVPSLQRAAALSSSKTEAFEEAHALAHRVLAGLENE